MSEIKNFWLVSGYVQTEDRKSVERQKNLNVLITTQYPQFTRRDLDDAQKAMMHRFVNETKQIKGAEISDVFIQSISNLGVMSKDTFQSEASYEVQKELQ